MTIRDVTVATCYSFIPTPPPRQVSCGFASRGNDMSVKRSLLVYDLRMMRSLNAVHCSIDPLQLRFMPMYHSQVDTCSAGARFKCGQCDIAYFCIFTVHNLMLKL